MTKSAKADDEPRNGKKKVVAIVALLAVAAAAYFLVLKPKPEGDPEPVAGEVVTLVPGLAGTGCGLPWPDTAGHLGPAQRGD